MVDAINKETAGLFLNTVMRNFLYVEVIIENGL